MIFTTTGTDNCASEAMANQSITEKTLLDIPVDAEVADDYIASIELSNSCREFYRNRVEATHSFKQRMSSRDVHQETKKRTTIDDAMDKLRHEMASLMDQDLSLMKQLLTLNEAIEDLKVKRLYHVSKDSVGGSSHDVLNASDLSVSETDMFDSDADLNKKPIDNMNDRISMGSINVPITDSKSSIESFGSKHDNSRTKDIKVMLNGTELKVHHKPQSSLDSGYGDEDHFHHRYRGPIEVDL